MIYWTGITQNKMFSYKAKGKTYEQLYNNIQEQYGYDTIIRPDAYQRKKLQLNGYNDDDFVVASLGEVDHEAYDNLDLTIELDDSDYREMIEESDSQAYIQKFEDENGNSL